MCVRNLRNQYYGLNDDPYFEIKKQINFLRTEQTKLILRYETIELVFKNGVTHDIKRKLPPEIQEAYDLMEAMCILLNNKVYEVKHNNFHDTKKIYSLYDTVLNETKYQILTNTGD